jgi:hypothetical protein
VTVFQYVDLETGEVQTRTSSSVSFPPSNAETDAAMELLLASPESATLREQFETATGGTLGSASDIEYIGGAYHVPAGNAGIGACASSRCVEFQVRTLDGQVLEPAVVVDLSAQVVRTFAN